jgi:hypothetical protein
MRMVSEEVYEKTVREIIVETDRDVQFNSGAAHSVRSLTADALMGRPIDWVAISEGEFTQWQTRTRT